MKKLLIMLICFQFHAIAFSQEHKLTQIDLMKKVKLLEGNWDGIGWISFGKGQKKHFHQTEEVRSILHGLILTIEGKGTVKDSKSGEVKVLHNAFAVVNYDMRTQKFAVHSYKDGNFLNADAYIGEDGSFNWGFDLPKGAGKIRYTIRLNERDQWYEIGEFSRDGKTWNQNFEMTLDRVE